MTTFKIGRTTGGLLKIEYGTGSTPKILAADSPIVTSGLVLLLDAGNTESYPGSGTTWTDLSGNGNHGTLTSGPTYSSANRGSLVFDGIDDYVIDSSTTNIPVGSSSRTIEFWVYPKGDTNVFVVLGPGGVGSTQIYSVQFYNIGGTRYLFTDAITANNQTISGAQLPTLNAWNHIVFGNSGQDYFYYVNGVLQKSGTFPANLNTVGQKYLIGKRTDYASNTMNANMARVSIYNIALSEAEITQNFNALRHRYGV
jgi:hypothetical protein